LIPSLVIMFYYYLGRYYTELKIRERPWEQRNDPVMVGDLPLKQQDYLLRVLDAENPPPPTEHSLRDRNHYKARQLESIQVLLHLEGQKTEAVAIDGEMLRENAPYHEEIRANWEQFTRVQANNQPESFKLKNMTLPPAPFFRNHIVPILQNDTLVSLDLIGCNMGPDMFQGVAEILNKCPTLITLGLAKNNFENVEDAKALSLAVSKHKGLFFVDLSTCGLGGKDDILSLLLKGCKQLNGLDLSWNGFSSGSLSVIANFFLSNHIKTVTILGLRGSSFDDKSATLFNKALEKKNNTMEQLSFASTNVTLSTDIQRNLVLNDRLLHIDLSGNSLGKIGAKYIAKHLKKNPPLSILSLKGCGLPNQSAKSLCNALKRNTHLAHFFLDDNKFNDSSVPFFADALRSNSTLLSFHMSGNNIKVKSKFGRRELINRALCNPDSLQTIAASNHTCLVTLNSGKNGDRRTHEDKFRKINALENEGKKIRYKVIAALFTLKTIEFNPREFQHIPLELMPRLLELVQQEMGYGKYGREVWKAPNRAKGSNPRLTRVYEVVHGWSMLPSLFARGPGKLKKKAAKKRKLAFAFKEADDEKWTPKSR